MIAEAGGGAVATGGAGQPPGLVARLARRAAGESYLVLLVCAAATLLLLGLGFLVTPDTWLALASGRVVAHGGPPSTDTLTAWTLGHDWTDQQWLGQLLLYRIWQAGGLVLVGLAHVVVVLATFVAALVAARRRGGSPRHVAMVGLLAVLPLGLVAGNIRAQTFALALFVAVLWLLAEDSRSPSRRVFWSFPLLVLWANVHGSVIVGAGLVATAGAVVVVHELRERRRSELAHGIALVAMAPVALLATPYGLSLFAYFGDTFGNPEIARIAPEWMPTAFEPVNAPFYVLAALTLVLVGRERGQLTPFEQLALVLLLAGALAAVRNLAWFVLAAVVLVPALATRPPRPGDRRPPPVWLAAGISAIAVLAVIAAAVRGLGETDRQVESRFPSAAVAVVSREALRDPSPGVFAHPRYADWLLFRQPRLAGRIPFDIRFELLTPDQLRRFRRFRHQIGAAWLSSLGGARLVVLDSSERPLGVLPPTSAVLLREPRARRLYAAHDLAVVLLAPRRAAAR